MMSNVWSMLAQSDIQTSYTFQSHDPWQWLLIAVGGIVILGFIAFMYWMDSAELPKGTTVLLVILRICAFGGLLLFFMSPEKRSVKTVVKPSRVSVLIDTSASMGLRDVDPDSPGQLSSTSRMHEVVLALDNGRMIDELRQEHEVVVYNFDEAAQPTEIAAYSKVGGVISKEERDAAADERYQSQLSTARTIATVAAIILGCSIFFSVVFFILRAGDSRGEYSSWVLLLGVLLFVASIATLAFANLASSETPLLVMLGFEEESDQEEESSDDSNAGEEEEKPEVTIVNWEESLQPRGLKTRLGDALRFVVNKERGGPIAGIVVFTDGCSNDGVQAKVAAKAASEAEIPVYLVGVGSTQELANVRLADVHAPPRVFPGDKFTITALVQGQGLEGQAVGVRLQSAQSDDDNETSPGVIEDEFTIELGKDGVEVPVVFELTPDFEGKRNYMVTVIPKTPDRDQGDNRKTVTVEVVQRKNRVLLIAGGPTREFRFLRNQLYRDKTTTLDVLLQTGRPGIAQESDELLFDFPDTTDELFEYDCIIAFDADWRALNVDQIKLLERWVAEQAGGLVVVAGPVYTPEWTRYPRGDERMDMMRALYPVSFFHQGATTIKLGRFGGDEAWPLQFTREGRSAEFLWLDDNSAKSEAAWGEFEGVYGYYAVNRPKSGAQVFARFSDPGTRSATDGLPIYLAGHFYGAGRVFFQASGEMWRVRSLNDTAFERFYTQLLRWASQGRLLRDSERGVLLIDKDQCLVGDHFSVRAILKNPQLTPLEAESVDATLIHPDGQRDTITLRATEEGTRPGTFAAQLTAIQRGTYTVVLAVPESEEFEVLSRSIQVRAPQKEIEKSQRNDALLEEVANKTKGKFFEGMVAAIPAQQREIPLIAAIEPHDIETQLSGNPDRHFTKLLMGWLLTLVTFVLCFEWLIRRLSRLA